MVKLGRMFPLPRRNGNIWRSLTGSLLFVCSNVAFKGHSYPNGTMIMADPQSRIIIIVIGVLKSLTRVHGIMLCFFMTTGRDGFFPYVSVFGSWGKRDCQACRNHGFNYKYCWRPIFQVNKQQPAYGAGFGSEDIRLAKFKSLRWEPSPIIPIGVCFLASFKWYWDQATACVCMCVHVMLISIHQPEIGIFRMGPLLAVKVR